MEISTFGNVFRTSHVLNAVHVQSFWTGVSDYSCKSGARGLICSTEASRNAMA